MHQCSDISVEFQFLKHIYVILIKWSSLSHQMHAILTDQSGHRMIVKATFHANLLITNCNNEIEYEWFYLYLSYFLIAYFFFSENSHHFVCVSVFFSLACIQLPWITSNSVNQIIFTHIFVQAHQLNYGEY